MNQNERQAYWRANTTLIRNLLIIWAVVSIGMSILFVQPLNAIRLGSVPLGFWMAQQGSIYVFVILIFVYAHQMEKIERKYLRNGQAALQKDPESTDPSN
ncbi:DUF4212 domain-containing protein [Pantanalinema rosaneae CENA516]|uniref:DUF4212 domain-containing protein n=1 Tax=Pantanalinema rosaneae TaxID=1620701 RepID=UPI003D6F0559